MRIENISVGRPKDGRGATMVLEVSLDRTEELEASDIADLTMIVMEWEARKAAPGPLTIVGRAEPAPAQTSGRQRTRAAAPEPEPDEGPAEETPAPTGRQRQRGGNGASPAQTSGRQRTRAAAQDEDETPVSDADIAKACSNAAGVITPKAVMKLLGDFGGEQASDIKPEFRRGFLSALNEAVEKAS